MNEERKNDFSGFLDSFNENIEIMLELAEEELEKVQKYTKELREELKKEEAKETLLSQRIVALRKALNPALPVTRNPEAPRRQRRKQGSIQDHIYDILCEVHPKPLHAEGIRKELEKRGVKVRWKNAEKNCYNALVQRNDGRFEHLGKGIYSLSKESFVSEAAATKYPERKGENQEDEQTGEMV